MAKRRERRGRLSAPSRWRPRCSIDNALSNQFTVVEVSGLDRPGLLFELTNTLSDLNLDITSAHITTFGEKAVDVFYVTDLTNKKITSPQRHAAIRTRLLCGARQHRLRCLACRGRVVGASAAGLQPVAIPGHVIRAMHLLRYSSLTFLAAVHHPACPARGLVAVHDTAQAWNEADWSSAHILPPARSKPEALVHVYAARTGRWKGVFAHHSWIVVKERGASTYTRFDKVAWGQPIKINNWAPDARWYGHSPKLVGAVEGPAAEALIPKIRAGRGALSLQSQRRLLCLAGPQLQLLRRLCAGRDPGGRNRPAADRRRQGLAC